MYVVDRINTLTERWILPEYRMPLLFVYSVNAFLFIGKVVFGGIIEEISHSHLNVRTKSYHNPIQIILTNFIPLLLPFFASMVLQRMNTNREHQTNN